MRRINYARPMSFQLPLLERAFVEFYAKRFDISRAQVIRTIVTRYVNGDQCFDPNAFLEFAERQVLPDPGQTNELGRLARDYAAVRANAKDSPPVRKTTRAAPKAWSSRTGNQVDSGPARKPSNRRRAS